MIPRPISVVPVNSNWILDFEMEPMIVTVTVLSVCNRIEIRIPFSVTVDSSDLLRHSEDC